MALNADIQIASMPRGIAGLVVEAVDVVDAISELFEATVAFESTDATVQMSTLVGQQVVLRLLDEPFLPSLAGIIRKARQLTCEPTGMSKYEIVVVPPLWLATRRSRHTIHQGRASVDVARDLCATYGGRIPAPVLRLSAPAAPREYVAQCGETDHDTIFRLLAEDGLASYFDGANAGAWTIVDDTTLLPSRLQGAVPFVVPASLTPSSTAQPHVTSVATTTRVTTTSVTVRSYDPDNPRLALEASALADPAALFANEADLEHSDFDAGDVDSPAAAAEAAGRRLGGLVSQRHRLLCETSFALAAGTEWTLTGHPRSDVGGALLVVRARTVLRSQAGSTVSRHVLECVDATVPYRPPARSKPRVAGTQTARVVASVAGTGIEIDVDAMGRVLVELHWDRRGLGANTSRRVRVAQAWAGPGYGLVTLPRVGDEVIVAYLDGDPDQPLVVGRVHNAIERTPLALPGDETISVWRSRSSPGGGGFNQILMDDKKGSERLELRAELDHRMDVGRNSVVNVAGGSSTSVAGNAGTNVTGDVGVTVGGSASLGAPVVNVEAGQLSAKADGMFFEAGHRVDQSAAHHIGAGGIYLRGGDVVQVVGPRFEVNCDEILLKGGNITLDGGTITIKADGDVNVSGALIKLNC